MSTITCNEEMKGYQILVEIVL